MHQKAIPLAAALTLVTLSAAAGSADKQKPLDALAFLAGHCWTAPFPDGKSTDTHCFEWVHGGHQLRDRHAVRAKGATAAQYEGETLYLWDARSGQIIYRYVDSTGGHSDGHVRAEQDALVFPADLYVGADGKQLDFVTQWRRLSDKSYEAKTLQRVGADLKEAMSFQYTRND